MRNARRTLSRSTFWGMIPLALWAGMPATGCFCATGGYKPFCGGHFAVGQTSPLAAKDSKAPTESSDAARHCPACAVKESSANRNAQAIADGATCAPAVASQPCCNEDPAPASGNPLACCQLSEAANITLTPVLSLPDFDALGLPCVVEVVSAPRLAAAALARSYEVFETGPPIDRVIVLCSLLI